MEKLPRYRQAIMMVLSDLAEISANGPIEALALFDTSRDNYLVVSTGWRDIRRIHHVIAHMRLHHDKIWVEADNTDRELVQQLLDAGISREEIVLAFHSPQKRPLTEFAVA